MNTIEYVEYFKPLEFEGQSVSAARQDDQLPTERRSKNSNRTIEIIGVGGKGK